MSICSEAAVQTDEETLGLTEEIFLWQYFVVVSASTQEHSHTPMHTSATTPNQGMHGTAYPVSGGGNMSVPAEDELLLQSLEQSLCPNEEDSTDSTPTFYSPPP